MPAYVDQMFSVNEVPWHRIGTVLDDPPTIDEAIKLAGLDWEVKMVDLEIKNKVDLFGANKVEQTIGADGFKAICRTTKEGFVTNVFGVVTDKYEPLQNIEAFRFFQPFIDSGFATLETAGSLKDGEIIWILAKIGEDIKVGSKLVNGDDDIVSRYVLLHTSHNGKGAVKMSFNPIRVVCWNTLSMAKSYDMQSVSHFSKVNERVSGISAQYSDILRNYDDIGKVFKSMSEVKVDDDIVEDFLGKVIPLKAPEQLKNVEKKRATVIDNLGIESKTLWGLYNAFTGFVDYDMKMRGGDDGRLSSIWFGYGARIKTRAFSYLRDYLRDGNQIPSM